MWFDGDGRRWREVGAHPRHVRLVRLARVERVGIHRGLVILARLHSDAVSSDGVLPGKPLQLFISRHPQVTSDFFSSERVFVASETAKATVPCVSHSPRRLSYPNHNTMPYRPYERRSTYERSWLYRHKAVRDYPSSTITEPRHPTPPPLKPTMAEADDDKKWYSKPNKRESLWGLGGMAVRPFSRFSAFPGSPTLARRYRARPRGCLGAQSFPKLPSTHPSTSPSTRHADRILRRRHRLPHQEGEGREGGQEVTRSEDAHAPLSTTDAAARRGDSNFGGGFNR